MTSTRRGRPAFSLVELMIVVVLLGIVGGALMNILVKQQRFYRGENQVIANRSEIRQAAYILPADLYNVSTAGSDIKVAKPDTLEFLATVGSGIVCSVSGSTITIPPLTLASKAKFSSWLQAPVAGDGAFIFNDSAGTNVSTDDGWQKDTIVTVTASTPSAGVCPSTTGYTAAADASQTSYTITLSNPVSGFVLVGAPVRFMKRVRYELKKNASDNQWYLYYNTCRVADATACASNMQPIAGPFLANSGDASTAGIQFEYFDVNGSATTVPANIARIRMTVRGRTLQKVNFVGQGEDSVSYMSDELNIDISVRNR